MKSDKIVTVFRTRVRPGFDEELTRLGSRMYELASEMPGFTSYKDFGADDREFVSIIELGRWKTSPHGGSTLSTLQRKNWERKIFSPIITFKSFRLHANTLSRKPEMGPEIMPTTFALGHRYSIVLKTAARKFQS